MTLVYFHYTRGDINQGKSTILTKKHSDRRTFLQEYLSNYDTYDLQY